MIKKVIIKTLSQYYLFVFTVFLIFVPGPAQSGISKNGDVVRQTLKNGLRIVIVRNTLAPVVSTQVNYLVGSNESPGGFPGMAHAQEHMMFRGSPGLSADQLANIIAALGGDFNADTQQEVTQYFFTVPAEYLDVALHVEAVRMQGVLDSQKLWEKERGAIEQEVARDLSTPEYVFYTKLLAHMFAGTPYAHDALGTRPSFGKTSGQMLQKFHDAWYGPNNAVLIIVGDVDPERTLAMAKELFEKIPSRPLPTRPAINLQPLKATDIALDSDLPYGLAIVAYRMPGYESPDYAAGQVLADILDSQRGDIYALAADGKALSAGFSNDTMKAAGIGYATAAFPKGQDGTKLIGTVKDVIGAYVKNGFPDEMVEAAKRHEIADAEFQKNSVSGLAFAWSQALAVEGRSSPEDDINAFKRVTAEDVNHAARKYLDNETAVVAILTPKASGSAAPSRRARGKESFAPERTKKVKLPDWAKKAGSLPAALNLSINPYDTLLPNGLRLIVQPETISGTISIYGQIKTNSYLQEPKGKEGVARILDGLFSYGTNKLDRLSFQKALDDIAANETAGSSFMLQVLTGHFDRGLELLAQNLLQPALPDSGFRVLKGETIGMLAGQLKSPSYIFGRSLKKGLYPSDDPVLREATPDTVSSITLDDVKKYYKKAFRPDMTAIVVIGQVTPEQATSAVEKYFGAWTATGPKPDIDLPAVPPNKPSSYIVPDKSRVQVEVILAETLGITRASEAYYPLQTGIHVLSGAFYATRLYRDLREEAGLVYTVDAALDAGKTRTDFFITYACDKQNISKARELAERDLLAMRTKPVSPEELLQAKILMLRNIPLSQSSIDGIAGGYISRSLKDLPLDEPMRAAQHYRMITADQVKDAFTKWIDPGRLVQVTLGPAPK